MTLQRVFERVLGLSADHDGDPDHISSAGRRAIVRHELTRGVDLPAWRSPKEIADMQREARDAA